MFTGLVQESWAGRAGRRGRRRRAPAVEAPLAGELGEGDSVAVNGVCLTAVELGGGASPPT